MSEKLFNQPCIVEIMGFNQVAGWVTEETIAGAAMIRVDVPTTAYQPGFTKYFSSSAIYAITPVTEELAHAAAEQMRVIPVQVYIPPTNQLPAGGEEPDF